MKHHSHARRPSIGISPDVSTITAEAPSASYELKSAYADAVLRAGGLPLVLPYSDDRAVIEAYLDRVSGVLVTGGAFDIAPELLSREPSRTVGEPGVSRATGK